MMRGEFTGRHMTGILVVGFGIVMAVNFTMAWFATHGFGGVVVENSYVASQKFNTWIEEAREQEALGWTAAVTRDRDGRLVVDTQGVPATAQVSVHLRHPLGRKDEIDLALDADGLGRYLSQRAVPAGRWIARTTIAAHGSRWAGETHLE